MDKLTSNNIVVVFLYAPPVRIVDLHTHQCYIESAREVKRKREEVQQRKRAAKRRAQAVKDPEPMDVLEELMDSEDLIADPVAQPVEDPTR